MSRWRGALFVAVLVLVILAHIALVLPGLFHTRLWEDEAYNLTVPLNLLAGHGYASDGILAGGGPLPFDARISTGPTVLLPVTAMLATGIAPVLGGRIVMLLFYAALLAGLGMLGRRIAGRWGGLAAVCVPLALNTNQLPSPVQGPTDILGELPAAMFLVFALVLAQRHPLWAGLLAGLAVQTKFLALLAVPAVLVAVWLSGDRRLRRAQGTSRWWRVIGCAVLAAVPTIADELWQLIALGCGGFVRATRQFGAFLLSGGQEGVHDGIGSKVALLADSWFVPWWLVVLVALVAVLVLAVAGPTQGRALLAASAVAFVVWLGWWLASSHTPAWVRYPAPVLLAFVPVVAAAVVGGIRAWWHSDRLRVFAVAVVTLLVAVTGAQAVLHGVRTWTPQRGETLPEQRQAASAIAALDEPQLQSEWGGAVSVIVMAGSMSRLTDAVDDPSVPLVLASYGHADAARSDFDARVASQCAGVLLRTGDYVVCRPAP